MICKYGVQCLFPNVESLGSAEKVRDTSSKENSLHKSLVRRGLPESWVEHSKQIGFAVCPGGYGK